MDVKSYNLNINKQNKSIQEYFDTLMKSVSEEKIRSAVINRSKIQF
jgi:hypothetical protein